MGFKATDLSSVSATFRFVTSLPLSLSAFSFKLAPAVLLDHETTKVTVLSVQGFQITAAIILGLRTEPSLREGSGLAFSEHLSCAELCAGHFKAA